MYELGNLNALMEDIEIVDLIDRNKFLIQI